MHIPDGFLSIPVSASAWGITTVYALFAHRKMKEMVVKSMESIPLIACTASFIFAAQMLNFPVLGGTSGHFLGATLATILFGPFIAFLVLSIVLAIQCLFFADGGLLALGANIIIMGVVAPLVASVVLNGLKTIISERWSVLVASWASVVCASLACSLLLSLSGTIAFAIVTPAMLLVHALIGIGEALITAAAVFYLQKTAVWEELKGVEA
ncbi:MAG: energy-coupling factor ABC transporter permease [Oligoflexia bacterium]|nr:energy-coupling factor ABC transporter permease [Oligoflexia bacterium]MBF0364384.1 energy-coupling factor ABC transporter permease [Oligoflexia bacterium]